MGNGPILSDHSSWSLYFSGPPKRYKEHPGLLLPNTIDLSVLLLFLTIPSAMGSYLARNEP